MADKKQCGAKTRKGTPCRRSVMPNGRCMMHGGKSTGPKTPNTKNNALKHGFYSTALQPDEKILWDRVEIGGVDDEIRLLRVKLHRLVKLSGSQEVADLVDAALEVARKHGDDPQFGPFDRTEIKVKAARYGDLILQGIAELRKLEMSRMQMQLIQKQIDAGGSGANDGVSGFEVVPYDDEAET